jgi:tetratricopeptide (TPR) repeat protein
MRGRLEAAAAWYREAAALASDRAVPRTALGSVELRLGHPDLALESFDAAIALAPADDAGLMGRAQALVVLERPEEAAATFDLLAGARESGGKLSDACDALRRALEIEATPPRRARYRELTEELRQVSGDAEAERALARAPWLVEVDAVVPTASATPGADEGSGGTDDEARAAAPDGALDGGPGGDADMTEPGPGAPAAEVPAPVVDGNALVLAADEAAARGDVQGAVAAAVAAARAFRAAGHPTAALDACVGGLRAGPGDADLHLLIAELAVERGALGSAADTYRGLLHLVEIEGDTVARDRVLAAAREALPEDPRFAAP